VTRESAQDGGASIRALLFDVDGTLYELAPLRRALTWRLPMRELVLSGRPLRGVRRIRALQQYRRVLEELRLEEPGAGPKRHLELAAQRSGLSVGELDALVQQWMLAYPLRFLLAARREGLVPFLEAMREKGIPCAAYSDYPAEEKLRALGIAEHFAFCLDSSDPRIGSYKPDPRGQLLACELFGLPPERVLYVGDREEVDGAAAEAAGMPAAILGSGGSSAEASAGRFYRRCRDFEELLRLVEKGAKHGPTG